MSESVIVEHLPNYISAIVNVGGFAVIGALDGRGCERNEFALFDQQGMTGRIDSVRTNYLAVVVDSASGG